MRTLYALLFGLLLSAVAACSPTAQADDIPVINGPATIEGYQPAVRVSPPPPPDLALTAVNDLPLPQEELPADLCAHAKTLRVQAGLPVRFDGLAFRESRCQNDVRTYCCYGIYQLYWGVISRDHRMMARIAACGVDTLADIYGETPVKRRNNTCVAKALYDVAGYSPWAR